MTNAAEKLNTATTTVANDRAVIGGNNPPDPIDEALAPWGDVISEAENWLDGTPVENEAQMKQVDAILKEIKKASTAVTAAEKECTAPLHDAWKAEKARWKPTLDDLDRMKKGLPKLTDAFKRKLAEEKAAAERKAREEAERKQREAEEAARAADATDIEAKREAEAKIIEAKKAAAAASKASKDTVKGMRTVTRFEITDHRALLHWIAQHRKADLTAFIEAWAQSNHKTNRSAEGLRVWDEKEAF